MKNPLVLFRAVRCVITYILLVLSAPVALKAQQTVFYDSFTSSTINGGTTTNMIPGGTPTASYTSYEIGSGKDSRATIINPGDFQLISSPTSSGNDEAQALFTKFPVTLAADGDFIELDVTFVDDTNVLNGLGGNSTGPLIGLYNSGGVPPLAGTNLWNGGFSSSLSTAITGGTRNWVGYQAGMFHGLSGGGTSWTIAGRPAQSQLNNTCQQLLYGITGPVGQKSANPGVAPFPTLTVGAQYTAQLRITLSNATLIVSNALFSGPDTTGTVIFTNVASYTGANLLTTNFDGLAVGSRPGDQASPHIIWTNDFTAIKVIAGLAAQAGPYFFVTSGGDPCSGGVSVGLSGSVTTNEYLLYTNGVYSGQSVAGTGSAISFGVQTVPANYTVIATNPATMGAGPMYGSASVYVSGVSIALEPSSLTLVTNVTASFSVTAVGASLSYQWYKNGVALANGGNISGAQTTNLVISPTTAADAATAANGYYVVVQTPCGDIITSTPNASLTLIPPHNLVWTGSNNGIWDYASDNFTLSGSPANFTDGDDVTFSDGGNGTVSLTNSVIPTLVTVNASQGYTINDGSGTYAGKISGFGQLVDMGSGTLTIANDNNYSGGTIVTNGATLQLGTGSGTHGSVAGIVTVYTNATLQYNFSGPGNATPININNGFAGNGTINFNDQAGSIIQTVPTIVSSNFTGTINVQNYTSLHAADGSAGYPLGNGSTINVPDNAQVWLDRSGTADNNTFYIGGTGWEGSTPYTGAMRVYGCTINGPIYLTDNARIGGTINGATIQSVITGPHQLEVWGTTNSFVLVMGPTNGQPQAYASTLITAGAIRAANSNAISTGPLTLDSGGDLQLYGNNLSVSNLSSINSGQVLTIEGPRIRNMNSTNSAAATLTVGADNNSSEFDGTFSDGSTAPLGLTKVGNGTLTLTLLNSNTGPVTVLGGKIALSGSGAFNKAPIAIGSGATFDVNGAGGTLALTGTQALSGNGTLAGSLTAAAGTLVNPGMPMGTLTVSGSAVINGTYRADLNRTNSGNCSTLAASSVTFSGATLSATNVGPALQAGDVFQLFPGATAGFSGANLQTYDYANAVNYTWNNTVPSDGKITVATVTSRALALQTAPTASAITLGQAISNSVISGGSVTNTSGVVVPGTFAFVTPGTVPAAGTTNQMVTFTPTDTTTYNSFTFTVVVTVASPAPTGLKFISAPALSGNNLIVSVTNSGSGTFYLLGSTNVAAALNTWRPLWTNVAAGSGNSTNTVTNAVNPALGKQFYILSTTNNN